MAKTITVTWQDGRLIAHCPDDPTLDSNTVTWPEPITAASDSWAIAHAITEINHADIVSVYHDGSHVHVGVSGERTP